MASSDTDIASFLNGTLHEPLLRSDLEDDSLGVLEDRCPVGCCRRSDHFSDIETWRKRFKSHLEASSVKPGSLLMFGSTSFPDAFTFILGVVVKRPSLHMLMKVSLSENEARFELVHGAPVVLSEREVFLQLLQLAPGRVPDDLTVEVWHCQAFLREGSRLYAVPDQKLCVFNLNQKLQPKPKRAAVKLPFGLQPEKKQRQRRPKCKPSAKAGVRQKGKFDSLPPSKRRGMSSMSLDLERPSDEEVPGSSESDEDANLDPNQESEQIVVSDTVRAEERNIPELEREIEEADQLRAETAAAIRLNRPAPGGRQSSFFSKEEGLAFGAIAVSGRSVCLCCKLPIAKGSVRFAWYHSLYRPHGWIHSTCAYDFVKATGLKEVAVRRLLEIAHSGSGSSSSHARSSNEQATVPAEVVNVATQLLAVLNP